MWKVKSISKEDLKKEYELNLSFYGSKIDECTLRIVSSSDDNNKSIWQNKLKTYSKGYNKIVKDYNKKTA